MSDRAKGGCPACESSEVSKVCRIEDHEYRVRYVANYASCAECQTAYQVPMPDTEGLYSFYPEAYHSRTNSGFLSRVRSGIRVKRIRTLLKKTGVILDYGCGNGAFLQHASRLMPNHSFFGYEISRRPQVKK